MNLDDFLAADPDARRCLAALTGQEPLTVDAILSCYGGRATSADVAHVLGVSFDDAADDGRAFEEQDLDDDELLGLLNELVGVTPPSDPDPEPDDEAVRSVSFGPPPDPPVERIAVPTDLVEQVNRTYEELSRLSEREVERELYRWLSEA